MAGSAAVTSAHPGFGAVLALLTLVRHAALLGRFDSAIPSDPGDPLLNTWILWWNAHHVPFTTQYWNAPAFAPAPYALALSETLLGLTWLTTPLQWLGASPLMAYNVTFVMLPVLNGLSAYWLCSILTNRRDAATIGGLAYAFAPVHASQLAHIQMEAMFWMPIALVGLHRYWVTGQRKWLACLCAAFILNGLTSGYLLLYFSAFLAIGVIWLTVASGTRKKVTDVLAALAIAGVCLAPVMLTYRFVARMWGLNRTLGEIESFSADMLHVFGGSDRLWLWPVKGLLYPQYPGLVITLLVLGCLAMSMRRRPTDLPLSRWRSKAVTALIAMSGVALAAACIYWIMGPWEVALGPIHITVSEIYKPVGFGVNLLLLAALLSPRFTALVRSGSLPGLYATGAVAATLFALGPVGRLYGERVWYKPPFAWLMMLPGFDSSRVPARFAAITVLCLAVLAAYAVVRLMPHVTRKSLIGTGLLAVAIVLDGWPVVPVVEVPRPLPMAVTGDVVVELPRSVFDDIAAMYRGIAHQHPVVNGYSGYYPPHYIRLRDDTDLGCFDSLDATRGGRSLDAVIWRARDGAAAIDAALMAKWGRAVREELPEAIVYHVPRDGSGPWPPVDPSIDLSGFCIAMRSR